MHANCTCEHTLRQMDGELKTHTHLFAIVCDRRKDGTECLKAHGDVQQVGSEEEVVVMTQNRHGHVPGQVQEGL